MLTIPATDLDIVLGKYLAAVSIYTVALLISAGQQLRRAGPSWAIPTGAFLSAASGLLAAGPGDAGSVGMVASFPTRNLTVAYILVLC